MKVSRRLHEFQHVMALEDLEGMLDVVISGAVYRRHRAALATAGPYVIEGRAELDAASGEPVIRAERIEAV